MAKENPNTPTKEKGDNSDSPKGEPKEPTPFENFDRLVKKIVRVPKEKAQDRPNDRRSRAR